MERQQTKEIKLAQLHYLESQGVNPYPGEIPPRTHYNADVRAQFDELENASVDIVGRLTSTRDHGKIIFSDVEDESGKIQVAINVDSVGEEGLSHFRNGYGIGDFIGVSGKVIKTKSGEPTIHGNNLTMLAKSLLPVPDSLGDVETRSRQRYLDMLANPEVKERFRTRSKIVQFMRERFANLDCIEVETPILDTTYGGANARPFETHHNALGEDLYLRISNELYLKRLVIGGLWEGVFEFSRDFRNEGMDKTHNPEFTQVELYKAYTDYNWMMDMSERLVSDMATEVLGKTEVQFNGHTIDLKTPWRRLSIHDGIKEATGVDIENLPDEEILKWAKMKGIEATDPGFATLELFEKFVESTLIQPTFVIDYPESTSPLTKKHRTKKGLVERFECFVTGIEVMNCYTELNDPRKQRANFEEELRRRLEEKDDQAMPPDEDFVIAMEYGMPPMGGIGISIDRWTMILTGAEHIREVITFPTMKRVKSPQKST